MPESIRKEIEYKNFIELIDKIQKDIDEEKPLSEMTEPLTKLLTKPEELLKSNQYIHEKSDKIKKLTKPSLKEKLEELKKLAAKRNRTELLGFKLNKFREIGEKEDGIQAGLHLIIADPHIGKSTLQRNLLFDLLESNPHLHILFVTLDDTTEDVIFGLISMLSGLSINNVKKTKGISNDEQAEIDKAYEKLHTFENRLCLLDAEIANNFTSIAHFAEGEIKNKKDIAIFVDAMFNIDTEEDSNQTLREKNIYRANELKRIADVYKIPVICTGEVRKRNSTDKPPTIHDIMESSKFAYNAKVIWILYPEDPTIKDPTYVIIMDWAKNKLSSFKGNTKLVCYGDKSQMEENSPDVIAREIEEITKRDGDKEQTDNSKGYSSKKLKKNHKRISNFNRYDPKDE